MYFFSVKVAAPCLLLANAPMSWPTVNWAACADRLNPSTKTASITLPPKRCTGRVMGRRGRRPQAVARNRRN